MKARKIPSKEKVQELIKEVVKRRLRVDSQYELALLVLRKLKKEDKEYTLSPSRAKRIALTIPEIEVRAKTKKSSLLKKIEECPVCKSEIKPVKIKNLLGKKIVVGYKCSKCGYESSLEAFMPMEYIFIFKRSMSTSV